MQNSFYPLENKCVKILDRIVQNGNNFKNEEVRKVLIIFSQDVFFLGDTFIKLDKFKVCRHYFSNAVIHLNVICKDSHQNSYRALLKHNPYIDDVFWEQLSNIAIEDYDLIICATNKESRLLEILAEKYKDIILDGRLKTSICSFSASVLYDHQNAGAPSINNMTDNGEDAIFSGYGDLMLYAMDFFNKNVLELNILNEERDEANKWLAAKGLESDERLFVFIDSASRKEKLLRTDVYFDVLTHILNTEKSKVLIFDEKSVGKNEFYVEWLGEALANKIIFSEGLSLRDDLCLLSSDHVEMILGPCTGLLQCASGIYNSIARKEEPLKEIPLLITYTGEYTSKEKNASVWWGARSPLMNCLLIKEIYGKKKLCLLDDLSNEEKFKTHNVMPCKEYTSAMIIDFITSNLKQTV